VNKISSLQMHHFDKLHSTLTKSSLQELGRDANNCPGIVEKLWTLIEKQ